MKVLQVNCVYAAGSTGKITQDLHRYFLAHGVESVVCYGRGEKHAEPGVIRLCPDLYGKANNLFARLRGTPYGGCWLSTWKMLAVLCREKPDVVHLQCLNGHFVNIPMLLRWLKKEKIPTVLTLHAEFMYTGNCSHSGACLQWQSGCRRCRRWRDATGSWLWNRTRHNWKTLHAIYRDWENLTVVGCSNWITARAKQSGQMQHRRCITIHNGIDNKNVFFPRPGAAEMLRQRYGIAREKKLLLYVAPAFTTGKGYDLVLQLMERTKDCSFHYLLVGQTVPCHLKNATVVGRVTDQNFLAQLYSGADVLLMCSRWENYPTVCLEAISCGTPVAGFAVGGVKETIFSGMGETVPQGDWDAMEALIQRLLRDRPPRQAVEAARAACARERMAAEYLALYREIQEGFPCEDPNAEQLF